MSSSVDCIYITACSHDARYTRICVASVRYFYPKIPIRLLVGGSLQRGLAEQLRRYWNIGIADFPAGNYGWGFVKLEPLFGTPGERFLVLDSDTVITGPILDLWAQSQAPFLVDDEGETETRAKEIYYDWESVRQIDASARRPELLFNTGQWFGTAGILTRDDFAPWIEWSMPRKTVPSGYFKNGEQGILNYVINRKVQNDGLQVERRVVMCWPGRSLDGLTAVDISSRTAAARVVHWAGMKRKRQKDMVGADLLQLFEREYYKPLPGAEFRRIVAGYYDTFSCCLSDFQMRIRLAKQRYMPMQKASAAS